MSQDAPLLWVIDQPGRFGSVFGTSRSCSAAAQAVRSGHAGWQGDANIGAEALGNAIVAARIASPTQGTAPTRTPQFAANTFNLRIRWNSDRQHDQGHRPARAWPPCRVGGLRRVAGAALGLAG